MKTNRILVILVIAMTTLCAALVWSNVAATGHAHELQAQLETKEAKVQELTARISHAPKSNGDPAMGDMLAQRDAEYEQLHEAYDKLKEQLSATRTMNVSVSAPTSTPVRVDAGPFPRRNMNAYLDRLRVEDPARYQQVTQRIQQRQQQAAQEYDDQMGTLAARAQNAPTPEEGDLVTQISDTLSKINQLRQERASVADLPPDQQQAQMQSINDQLRQAMSDLSTMRDQDRTIQYNQLADQLKLNDADKQILSQTIPQILKDTSYSPQRGPGGFGGGGPPPGTTSGGSTTTPSSPTTK